MNIQPLRCVDHGGFTGSQLAAGSAQTATAPFYAGKQIKLITHVGPASGYSVWAGLVGAHLGRHIPGSPSSSSRACPAPVE